MNKIRCVVERITYQNQENGYSVMKVKDKRYGQQFACETWEEVMPATAYGIEKYLGSGLVKGIGPKYAHLIVERFGTETIEVIEDNIERLYEVPGIGKKRVEKIRDSWKKQKDIKNVMIFLQQYGVSTAYAAKIYRQYGKDSIDNVKENPYRLADDIWGIGFKTADSIASKMGYEKNDLRRCKSGISYTLNELSNEGHVYAVEEQLTEAAKKLLEADEEPVTQAITEMIVSGNLIRENEAIYLPPFYYSERGTAKKLLALMHEQNPNLFNMQADIKAMEKASGITYDEVQIAAIEQAVRSKVMVLTGGPGTGKTTTTQGIITAYKTAGMKILLAAPTGRASKRMSEATGMEAKTIHRLLEFNPQDGYKRNEENPLEGDALIVDECSMIDIILMYNLMKAIPEHMRLVLVGDIDQLPSVGAGNVLRDIIDSEKIPVVRLTRIFRQALSSRIVMSAHAINQGRYPDTSNGKQTDFFFIKNEDPEQVATEIVNLVKHRLPKAYNQPLSNIQVLTPMQRSVVGAAHLNMMLQQALNTSTLGISRGGTTYKQGDRVMQIRNNYDKNVFNGDIGTVEKVNMEDRTISVFFEDHLVEYETTELDELTLAYATTIHKSQGSEYPIVVIPVLMTHFVMLQRNLIYTGITRVKKICVLIGQPKALAYAVRNLTVSKRNTKLKERLRGEIEATTPSPLHTSKPYVLPEEDQPMMAAEAEIKR